MIYGANKGRATVEAMASGQLAQICTPREGRSPAESAVWMADNGCFGKGYPGDAGYLAWLDKLAPHNDRCLFATAPDVVGDAEATLARSAPFYAEIRARGYRAALVAQDGLTVEATPWDEIDALFIGGTTDWKLGPEAAELCREAKARGKWVHVGRVNSRKRMVISLQMGADSCDGTFLVKGPDKNLPILLRFMAEAHEMAQAA